MWKPCRKPIPERDGMGAIEDGSIAPSSYRNSPVSKGSQLGET